MPPASNFAGAGGGDGWALALSTTQVFNVFHHDSVTTLSCHNQSNASQCYAPRTITGPGNTNFATSGHPGMHLDQQTGKLYVFGTRSSDSTAGVVCIDTTIAATNPNPFCGYTPLTAAGDGPMDPSGISGTSLPMQVGTKWYSFNYVNGVGVAGGKNKLLCFDLTTFSACAGQPVSVTIGAGNVTDGGFPSPATAAIGSEIIIPLNIGGVARLACFDAGTAADCSGAWPVAAPSGYPSGHGAPFPLLDGAGNITGLCLPTGADQCFTPAGASTPTPAGMSAVIGGSSAWNGPAFVLGPRAYVPNGNANGGSGQIQCYDYFTNASCANFPKSFANLSFLYTANPDPQRPSCLWVNADGGGSQIQDFDVFTGASCGSGVLRVLASGSVLPQQQCLPSAYTSLQILTPAPGSYTSGSVAFRNGDGSPIPGIADRPLDNTGTVDLTGLSLNTASGLPQFLVTFTGAGAATTVVYKLTWTGTLDPACAGPNTVVTDPAITAAGAAAAGTGEAGFSGTVATFNDPDTAATAGEYSASIDWGDGSSSSGTISGSAGSFDVSGNHTYAQPGSYAVAVTISDSDTAGNTATAVSTYLVAGPPTASISSPNDQQTYTLNQSVATTFSCAKASGGSPIVSCTDSANRAAPSGSLDTSTAGQHTYTVTATAQDGQTGTAMIHYVVAGPPTASISSPNDQQTYTLNQSVATTFSCAMASGGSPIVSCTDSRNRAAPSGSLDTSTFGSHTYTVTATAQNGQTGIAMIHYVVAGPPTASISSPSNRQTYTLNQSVATKFACVQGSSGSAIKTCTDSRNRAGPSGSLDTSTVGSHTYTVTATGQDGQMGTASIHYTVVGPPTVALTFPGNGAHYAFGALRRVRYSCTEAAGGPAIRSCIGSAANGSRIDTKTVGWHSFTVIATSRDGQRTRRTVRYQVRAASNHFTISHRRVRSDGTVTFDVKASCAGQIDVLETAGITDESAENMVEAGAASVLLQPAPQRFVFARLHLVCNHNGTIHVTVPANRSGDELTEDHDGMTLKIRLWVTYEPIGGKARTVGFFGMLVS